MVATRASLKVQFGWTLWLGDRGGSSNKFPVPACDKWVVRGTKAEEVQCRGRWGGGVRFVDAGKLGDAERRTTSREYKKFPKWTRRLLLIRP